MRSGCQILGFEGCPEVLSIGEIGGILFLIMLVFAGLVWLVLSIDKEFK